MVGGGVGTKECFACLPVVYFEFCIGIMSHRRNFSTSEVKFVKDRPQAKCVCKHRND